MKTNPSDMNRDKAAAKELAAPGMLLPTLAGWILATALAGVCFAITGASLALFISGFFFVTVVLPPTMLTQTSLKCRLLVAGRATDGVNLFWLIAALSSHDITLWQWFRCELVLFAYAALLAGLLLGLLRLRIAPIAASAVTIILALIWLSWPVWMSPYLTGPNADSVVAHLARFHPLFAVNGVLANLGVWSHWPIAYRELTTLGQDVPYSLPTSILPTFIAHLVIGLLSVWIQMQPRRRGDREGRREEEITK